MKSPESAAPTSEPQWLSAGTIEQLKQKGCVVVKGGDCPLAVFYHEGRFRAVDNRCPHMGFPLSKGSVHGGILTCHWHHARFDLASGCAFDLWADDVPCAAVEVRDGQVWVASQVRGADGDRQRHWHQRLGDAMAQDIPLVIGKAIIELGHIGAADNDILRRAALFGTANRDGWASGLTVLTAMGNVLRRLGDEEVKFLALYQGISRVAADCAGQPPRRPRRALSGSDVPLETLKQWMCDWTRVRHRDGAERTLMTAIEGGCSPVQLADLLLSAATERFYADGGHTLDFINKSLELLDLIGWEHAGQVLPSVIRQLVSARGGEESSAWRHPLDLLARLQRIFDELPQAMDRGRGRSWSDEAQLAEKLLSDDVDSVIGHLHGAIASGAAPAALGKALCLAAATRIARFGTSNEFGDWITALHTFTYCNALHQCLRRIAAVGAEPSPQVMRGLFHGAVSIYLDRFLNIPPAPLPGERSATEPDQPVEPEALLAEYLEALDAQHRVGAAAGIVDRYLRLGHPLPPLFDVLARGVLREDADFHTFQMLEASLQQFEQWGNSDQGRVILVALARYSAAHAPTQRSQLQTARIALRLSRGRSIHEQDEGED